MIEFHFHILSFFLKMIAFVANTISKLKNKCLQERMNVYANSSSPEAFSVRLFQKKTPQKRCRVYSAFDCSQEAQERKMQNLFWIDGWIKICSCDLKL